MGAGMKTLRGTCGLLVAGVLAASPAWAGGDGNGLGLKTDDQRILDRRTLRIFNAPDFQARLHQVEKLFEADPIATDPEARKMIVPDTAAIAFNEVQIAVEAAAEQPALMWSGDAPHRWFGMDVPFASYGLNNQDNIYRIAAIDGAARYEIVGRRAARSPAQTTIFLYNSVPGDGTGPIDGPIGGLIDKDIHAAPDGSFKITIDGDAPGSAANHIQSRPDAKLLIIRESLSDWAKETPAAMTLRRVGGPSSKSGATDAEVADHALMLASKLTTFWLAYSDGVIFKAPANTVGKPNARGGGWGYTANGRFEIADDEALVVTLDPATAAYVGFELADQWSIPFEFVRHSSSLANGQMAPNPDGTLTYVIAAKDPGVHNWLDTTGFKAGVFGIRWQNLTDNGRVADAVRSIKRVKLSDLAAALPAGTVMVTAAERKAQIAERQASWHRRIE